MKYHVCVSSVDHGGEFRITSGLHKFKSNTHTHRCFVSNLVVNVCCNVCVVFRRL